MEGEWRSLQKNVLRLCDFGVCMADGEKNTIFIDLLRTTEVKRLFEELYLRTYLHIERNELLVHTATHQNLRCNMLMKETKYKNYRLYDPIYLKFGPSKTIRAKTSGYWGVGRGGSKGA